MGEEGKEIEGNLTKSFAEREVGDAWGELTDRFVEVLCEGDVCGTSRYITRLVYNNQFWTIHHQLIFFRNSKHKCEYYFIIVFIHILGI